jgi:hypothetical protein
MKISILQEKFLIIILFFFTLMFSSCLDKMYNDVQKAPEPLKKVIDQYIVEKTFVRNCVYIDLKKEYIGDYFVAGEIYGDKMRGVVVGIWIVDSLDNPTSVLAVNQAAVVFSTAQHVKKFKPKATFNLKETRIIRNFIEKKLYKRFNK